MNERIKKNSFSRPCSREHLPGEQGPTLPQTVHIITNPTSGSANQQYVSAIAERLRAIGWTVSVEPTPGPNTAGALARSSTADIVAVAGGDGTIREVINGLVGKNQRLAIIPTGTANVLAAEIGLKKSVEAVVSTITHGTPHEFFLGQAGTIYFSAMASIGFDADVVANLSLALKKRVGRLAYVWTALRELASYHPVPLKVEIDHKPYECHWVLILNGRYYGGMFTCAPLASLTNKDLYICLLQAGTRFDVLRFWVDLVLGRLEKNKKTRIVSGQHMQVSSPDCWIQGDGDIIGSTPLGITTVCSGGLRILIPPGRPAIPKPGIENV